MAADTAELQAAETGTLYDAIDAWGEENIRRDEIPSPKTLHDVLHALHAIDEFLVDPIATALKKVARDTTAEAGPSVVDYEYVGRLIIWTDDVREECQYLLDEVADIALLAHEDLPQIAAGFRPGCDTLGDRKLKAELRRFHGLDRLLV